MNKSLYKFNFRDFRLIKVQFELKSDKDYKLTKDIEITTTISVNHELNKENNILKLIMGIDVCGDKLPFSLSVKGIGLFIFPELIKDNASLEKLAHINCAAILFPYLRESVAEMVRRAGLPQLNLPPINFVESYEAERRERLKG